jgi:GntR family phosphonate transport system transcriptional regulator
MTLLDQDRKTRATQWRRIADALEREIRAGVWAPGAALPNVQGLAARFGVNRHTVRQALQHLQQLDLLSIEQGRGTFVRAPRFDYRLGRRVRFATSLAEGAERSAPELLSIGIAPLGRGEARSLGLAEGRPAWAFRMRRIVDGAPLSTSFQRLDAESFPGFEGALRRTLSVTAALAECGVADYVRLSTHVAAVLPGEEERAALELGAGEPVLLTRGVDGLPSGAPFHLSITAFVASRVELVVDAGAGEPS